MIRYDTAQATSHRSKISDRIDTMRYELIRYDTLRYDTLRYDTIRYDTIRYDTTRYESIIDSIMESIIESSMFTVTGCLCPLPVTEFLLWTCVAPSDPRCDWLPVPVTGSDGLDRIGSDRMARIGSDRIHVVTGCLCL